MERILLSHTFKDTNDGFGSRESQEEYEACIQHRLLTQSWVQFDHKSGVSINEPIEDSNPTAFIRTLKEVGSALRTTSPIHVTVVHEQSKTKSENIVIRISCASLCVVKKFKALFNIKKCKTSILRVLITGFNGFSFLPADCKHHCKSIEVSHDTDCKTVFDSTKLFSYIAGQATIPIIIDTGASISLTPVITDFVGDIEPADLDSLQGLSSKTKVCGQGIIHWKIQDIFGMVRTISIEDYYVPEASIRLMSPKQYFQESKSGHAVFDGGVMVIHLPLDKHIMKFPFHNRNNLPFMLLNDHPSLLPISESDINLLCDVLSVLTSISEQTNQNLTMAQNELFLWHWKLAHTNL